jgi:hypothetical protein
MVFSIGGRSREISYCKRHTPDRKVHVPSPPPKLKASPWSSPAQDWWSLYKERVFPSVAVSAADTLQARVVSRQVSLCRDSDRSISRLWQGLYWEHLKCKFDH